MKILIFIFITISIYSETMEEVSDRLSSSFIGEALKVNFEFRLNKSSERINELAPIQKHVKDWQKLTYIDKKKVAFTYIAYCNLDGGLSLLFTRMIRSDAKKISNDLSQITDEELRLLGLSSQAILNYRDYLNFLRTVGPDWEI